MNEGSNPLTRSDRSASCGGLLLDANRIGVSYALWQVVGLLLETISAGRSTPWLRLELILVDVERLNLQFERGPRNA